MYCSVLDLSVDGKISVWCIELIDSEELEVWAISISIAADPIGSDG
jgi:hypothetical protein